MTTKWYEIKARQRLPKAEGEEAREHYEISILDEIGGWGITAKEFIDDYKRIPADADITLVIHSVGGSVFDALAIYNVLSRDKSRITSRVEGLAASSASIVLLAASEIQMPVNSYMMIHNPWSVAVGDYNDMQSTVELLKKVQATMAGIYADKTGKTPDEMAALMDAETWYTGEEAQSAGLVDTVLAEQAIAASLSAHDAAKFTKAPKAIAVKETKPDKPQKEEPNKTTKEDGQQPEASQTKEPMAADEIAQACEEAGFSMCAAALIRAKSTRSQVNARITEAVTIKELAAAAGRPEDGDAYIRAGISAEQARKNLLASRTKSAPNINNHANTDVSAEADNQAVNADDRINYRNIYAARKAATKAA